MSLSVQDALGQGEDVSRETSGRLAAFAALVARWTPRINLISAGTVPLIQTRHIADSAQLFPLAPPGFRHWADLGSGGGFPGIVVAIIAAERNPDAAFTLVESDARKAAFLRIAARELRLAVTVVHSRIETLEPLGADVVSARALGPLPQLLGLVGRHLAPDGVAILPKGRGAAAEIDAARASWRFDLSETPSKTDPEARLLRIERIALA